MLRRRRWVKCGLFNTSACISAGSMPVTIIPRPKSAWLAPPGALPISATCAPMGIGNCDQTQGLFHLEPCPGNRVGGQFQGQHPARPAACDPIGAMKADPPLIGLDQDAIENVFPAPSRLQRIGGLWAEHFWARALLKQSGVNFDRLGSNAGLIAVIARLGRIAGPNVDSLRMAMSEKFPCFPGHFGLILPLNFPQGKRIRPGKDGM